MYIYLVFVFVTVCRTCQIFVRGVLCRRSVRVITFSFSIQVCVVMCATPTFSSYFFLILVSARWSPTMLFVHFSFLYLALSFSIFSHCYRISRDKVASMFHMVVISVVLVSFVRFSFYIWAVFHFFLSKRVSHPAFFFFLNLLSRCLCSDFCGWCSLFLSAPVFGALPSLDVSPSMCSSHGEH